MKCFAVLLFVAATAVLAGEPPEPGSKAFTESLIKSRVLRPGEEVQFTRPGTWLIGNVGHSGFVDSFAAATPGRFVIGSQRVRLIVWIDEFDEWREGISISRAEITRVDVNAWVRARYLMLGTDRGTYTFALQGEGSSFVDQAGTAEAAKLLGAAK